MNVDDFFLEDILYSLQLKLMSNITVSLRNDFPIFRSFACYFILCTKYSNSFTEGFLKMYLLSFMCMSVCLHVCMCSA